MKIKAFLICSLIALSFSSCKKDNDDPQDQDPVETSYSTGILVSCEGAFGSNNASVSWIGSTGEVETGIYANANGFGPGDVLQSMLRTDEHVYLVVNNSQKVEVVDESSFENRTTITGVDYPRYMIQVSDSKIYLSNGAMEGAVKVIDAQTQTISGSIAVGNGPEQMTISGDNVFVANSGGWTTDNTVTVIDTNTDTPVSTIDVGDRPSSIVTDAQGDVWVMCAGEVQYDENWNVTGHTEASLQRIDPISFEVEQVIAVGELGDHPRFICFDPGAERVLIAYDGITAVMMDGSVSNLSPTPCSTIAVDPVSGEIYVTSVPDFVSNSTIHHLDSNGDEITTYSVGVGANWILLD